MPTGSRALACLAVVALLSRASLASGAPDLSGSFAMGNGGTDTKMQSKVWFNDGAWWAMAASGSSGTWMWKLENGSLVRQTFPDAQADPSASARADVLWDGTYLYAM